jgi:anti-anti-sigma regulatory factor
MERDMISIDGIFDPTAASALRLRVAASHDTRPVVVDFSRAREVDNLGIVELAHGLASDGIAVQLRGLSHHHERMLQYLGLDQVIASRGGAAAEPAPEPG